MALLLLLEEDDFDGVAFFDFEDDDLFTLLLDLLFDSLERLELCG